MVAIRHYRTDELPWILQAGVQTAFHQLVARDLAGATQDGIAFQLHQMYRHALAQPGTTILAADDAGGREPVGYVLLMPQPNPFTGTREAVILDIFVTDTGRGKGLGRRLLEGAAAHARQIGCSSLVAQVALHNQASMRLFQKDGFAGERLVLGRLI